MKYNQRGFTIIEIFVALAIGLFLFAGVMSIFVGIKTTAKDTSSYGELQENGRFAINLLTEDLLRQNFWGDLVSVFGSSVITAVPPTPANECTGAGLNNGTFPQANGQFRTLWGDTVANLTIMGGCITDAKIDSDVIQIKRVVTNPITRLAGVPLAPVPALVVPAGNFHLVANNSTGIIFSGTTVPTTVNRGQVWQYQHHIYYIREEDIGGQVVPVLMQGQLTTDMVFSPIVDGIEMIRFMYGIDANLDGVVDVFIPSNRMTSGNWNNAGGSQIIAVKIYVLVRNILPDFRYDNENTYQLGDFTFTPPEGDHYRRLLFSSTVTLFNSRIDEWIRQ